MTVNSTSLQNMTFGIPASMFPEDVDTDGMRILSSMNQTQVMAFLDFNDMICGLMNCTMFATQLNFTDLWNSTWDTTKDLNTILKTLQVKHVLWETYAFFEFFFGEYGILTANQTSSNQTSANQTFIGQSSGFL